MFCSTLSYQCLCKWQVTYCFVLHVYLDLNSSYICRWYLIKERFKERQIKTDPHALLCCFPFPQVQLTAHLHSPTLLGTGRTSWKSVCSSLPSSCQSWSLPCVTGWWFYAWRAFACYPAPKRRIGICGGSQGWFSWWWQCLLSAGLPSTFMLSLKPWSTSQKLLSRLSPGTSVLP